MIRATKEGGIMPSNISNYMWLCIMNLAIFIVVAYFGFDQAVAKLPMAGGGTLIIIVDVISFAISAGLLAAVAWGRQNWARWVQLILYVLGLAAMAIGYQKMIEAGSVQMAVAAIQTVIAGLALFFVFSGNAKEWFDRDSRA
jgi:hypothetical protein